MLSLEQLRKIDAENQLSNQELLELRDKLHPILEKVLDKYFDGEGGVTCPDDLHE
jgi:hypothetical protein